MIAKEGQANNNNIEYYNDSNKTKHISKNNDDTNDFLQLQHRQQQLQRVAYVSEKILHTARTHVEQQLQRSLQMNDDEEIEKWTIAKDSLNADDDDTHSEKTKWKFVLLDVPIANAFVSELINKRQDSQDIFKKYSMTIC